MKRTKLRRRATRLLCALLAAALLAGCSSAPAAGPASASGDAAQAAMGRWVESEVPLPQGLSPIGLYQLASGELWLTGLQEQGGFTRYLSADGGESWQQSPLPGPMEGGRVLTVSAQGAVLARQSAASGQESAYWRLAPGGEPEPFVLLDLPGILELNAYFIDEQTLAIAYLAAAATGQDGPLPGQTGEDAAGAGIGLQAAGAAEVSLPESEPADDEQHTDIYTATDGGLSQPGGEMLHGNGLYRFADGSRIGDWPGMAGDALATAVTNGERLFYESYSTGFVSMDAAGNQQVLYTGSGAGHLDAALAEADGTLYFENDQGIHRLAAGGSLAETVVEGSAFAFAQPDQGGRALARTASGDFLLLLADYASGDYRHTLYRYHYDQTLPAWNDEVLTVWSLEDSDTVRAAIAAFAKEHRDVEVQYTVARPAGQEGPAAEDLLRALNTELLAGGGPDVLILDGADYEACARQGLLADLSDTVSEIPLLENITGPFAGPDGLFVLPTRFVLPVLYAPAGRLAAAEDWDGLIGCFLDAPPRPDVSPADSGFYDALPFAQRYAFSVQDTADLAGMLLATSAPALLNADGTGLDKAALTRFYTGLAQAAQHYDLGSYRPVDPSLDPTMSSASTGEDVVIYHQSSEEYDWGRALFAREWMATPALLLRLEPMAGEVPDAGQLAAALQPGLAEGAYRPQVLTAVNAAAANPEMAREFVRAMLSDEVQSAAFDWDGLPVTQSGMQGMEARFAQARQYTEAKLENFHALLAAAKTPVLVSEPLRGAVLSHAEALAKGEETVAQAVEGTEADLALYFAERG